MNVMNCMKCGREIILGQVFCKDCLEDMSHYPVNPATPVQIPVQPPAEHPPRRNNRAKKSKKPEEQVLRLKKLVRIQSMIIFCLLMMLIGLGFLGYKKIYTPTQSYRPGENYMTAETTQQHIPSNP